MIKYLYANNYKSFVNLRIDFEQINLLIGSNGTGKSNVFALIACIRDLILGVNPAGDGSKILDTSFSKSTLTRWMKSNVQTFEMGVSSPDNDYIYRLEISHDIDGNTNRISHESVMCAGRYLYRMQNGEAELYDEASNPTRALFDASMSGLSIASQNPDYRLLNDFRLQIGRIILCIPDPRVMQDVILNDIYIPTINFSNIASVYAGITQVEPDIYTEVAEILKDINPHFSKLRITPEQFYKYLSFEYIYDDVVCPYHLRELSDGERMLFALYVLLYGFIKKGMTVLLDEPDNYISLREIQPWCRELENSVSDFGQCLMISHHPEIIDYMADQRGIWMSRLKSGESSIEKPDVGDNRELLTYSQMITRGLLDEVG